MLVWQDMDEKMPADDGSASVRLGSLLLCCFVALPTSLLFAFLGPAVSVNSLENSVAWITEMRSSCASGRMEILSMVFLDAVALAVSWPLAIMNARHAWWPRLTKLSLLAATTAWTGSFLVVLLARGLCLILY